MEPGRLRSARQKIRPAGQRDGRAPPGVVHQVERGPGALARGDRVAGVAGRAGRPLGADRRTLVALPHVRVVLEAARGQHDAPAGPDQRGLAVAGHLDPGDPAVLSVQAGHRGVQPDRYLLGQQAGPQAGGQGLSHAEHRLPQQAGARQPAEHLRAGQDGPGMAGAEAQPPVVGLGDGHAVRCRQVGRVEVGQLGTEHPPVQRHRLDAAPLGQPAGSLGIVVGVARHPGEVHRGGGAHEGEHGRAVLQQRPLPLRGDTPPATWAR